MPGVTFEIKRDNTYIYYLTELSHFKEREREREREREWSKKKENTVI